MKVTAQLFPLATILLSAHSAAAWGFFYNSGAKSIQGTGNLNCVGIDQKAGKTFSWFRDPSEDCCMYVYTKTTCSGDPVGWSCDDWSKTASKDFSGFKVKNC